MIIVGIDEVGRGCWAGPLVAGAVILNTDVKPPFPLRDSKKLSKKQRETLAIWIQENALDHGLGWVSATEVDDIGLTEAVRQAMQRAVDELQCAYDKIIIDGHIAFLEGPNVEAIIKADDTEPSVSAASILAKVARDQHMAVLSQKFPGYGFEKHVGYGTAEHIAALTQLGVSTIHRRSYKPIKALL